jgi:RES domain-containing protein
LTDSSGARLADLLARLPTRRMKRRLVRCVPQLDFDESAAPSYLFTSGRPNRCNPAGVDCLYFSETEATAQTEYRQAWRGTAAEHQPKLTFTARVHLRRILDLGNSETLRLLGLTREDLEGSWRLRQPTRLQELGRAISRQVSIAALRSPSAAAAMAGARGWNVAIFPASLEAPDRVEILGRSLEPLEILP